MASEGPFELVAGGAALQQPLHFRAIGVLVQNFTAQFVYIPGVGFIPPNSSGSFPIEGTVVAAAQFVAPPKVSQPTAVAGQICFLTYVDYPVPLSAGPTQSTAIASVVSLENFAKASLPAPGTQGRLAKVTDADRGVYKDTGTNWASLEGEVFDIAQFGAVGDSGVTDNGVAIRACITAAMAAPAGARIRVPRANGYFGFTGGLSVNGAVALSIIGQGGISNGGAVPSTLRATDAPARVLDARTTEGLVIEDCSIVCANAGFTGTVVDLGSANHWTISRCQVLHTAAGTFIDATNAILGEIIASAFNGSAITGASTGLLIGGASVTTIRVRDCNFKCSGNFTAIKSTTTVETDGVVIDGVTLDGVGNATPATALIDFSGSTLTRGLSISGLWTGDMGAASTGALIHAGKVQGLSIRGCFLAGAGNGSAQTGITTAASSDGIEIAGNEIVSLLTGLTIFTPVLDIRLTDNHNTAATVVAGYVPGGVATSPAVPASGVNATNNTGGYIMVYIHANGAAAITDITISGSAAGLPVVAGGVISVMVGPGQTISITYPGAAPTWTWFRF